MTHFSITLPDNRWADVRTGILRKETKTFLNFFLPWRKLNKEDKLAYIVKVEPAEDISEYRLLKTKDGKWLEEGENRWVKEGKGTLNLVIKKAIDNYENQKLR